MSGIASHCIARSLPKMSEQDPAGGKASILGGMIFAAPLIGKEKGETKGSYASSRMYVYVE